MPWEKDKKKRLAEFLWTEINKAILKSPDVQTSIKKLEQLKLLDYVSEFNLVLEVDKLIENILKQDVSLEAKNSTPDKLKEVYLEAKTNSVLDELQNNAEPNNEQEEKETKTPSQWVDGKALSDNEILFEEYVNNRFNEKHWLKKAKIRLDN